MKPHGADANKHFRCASRSRPRFADVASPWKSCALCVTMLSTPVSTLREIDMVLDGRSCSPILEHEIRTPTGALVYVESPDVLRVGRSTVLLGSPSFATNNDGSPLSVASEGTATIALAGVVLGGTDSIALIPSPLINRWVRSPRGLVSRAGTFDMLWMPEPFQIGDPAGLSATTWTNGKWSRAISVDTSLTAFRWTPNNIFRVAQSSNDSPWLLVGRAFSSALGSSRFLRRGARWSIEPFSAVSEPYPSAVFDVDGTILTSFVDYGSPDGNAVFVRRADSRGRIIGSPVRVSSPGSGAAYNPVLAKGEAEWSVIWSTMGASPRLAASRSFDGGQTWQRPVTVGVDVDAMTATSDAKGNVHVIAQVRTDDGATKPAYYAWSNGHWSKRWESSAKSFGTPTITQVGTDSLFVTWADPSRASGPRFLATRYWVHSVDCLALLDTTVSRRSPLGSLNRSRR